jgi:hypothetical protein
MQGESGRVAAADCAAAQCGDGAGQRQAEAVHPAAHAYECAGHGFSDERGKSR